MKNIKIFTLFLFALVISTASLNAQSANVLTVMNNYAAFGKGDIPAILATLTPGCAWYHAGNPKIVPFGGTFNGPDEIGSKFFSAIPGAVEITHFEPSLVGEQGNTVITSVIIHGKAVSTGKTYENTVEMRWTFDANGKVMKYENIFDPAALEAALTK
jgi:uncharacterized protein